MKNVLRATLSLIIAGSCAWGASSKRTPNIVFILADDLGWADTGVYRERLGEGSYYETPNIDRLASQGMLFTQATVSPMCSPTRAMLLTGKHNAATGILKATYECPHDENYDEIVNPNSWQGDRDFAVLQAPNRMVLDGDEQTFAEILKPQGITCGFLGKWHVGYHNKIPTATPQAQGFDVIAGYDTGGSPYRNWFPQWEKFGQPMSQPSDCYMTVAESREACRFIEENRKNPFLLYYCTGAVHSPFEDDPATGYKEHFEQKGRDGWLDDRCDPYPVYAAMVKSMDDAVGEILNKLDRTSGADGRPLSENTLVVFISDNGGINRFQFAPKDSALHDKAITSNFPLRGAKGNVYEGGIRVPFIVRWPGVTPTQSICDVPVTGQDICSLLMEASGLEKQADAGSLLALLNDPQDAAGYGRDTFFYHFPFWWPHAEVESSLKNEAPMSAVRKGKYKLIYYYTGRLELYDLAADISETHDLSSVMPEKTEELRQLLESWLKSEVDPRYIPKKNPKFDPSATPYGEFRDVMGLWDAPSSTSQVTVFLDDGHHVPGSSNSGLQFKTGDRDVTWDITVAEQRGLQSIGAAVMTVRMVPFNIFANSRGVDVGGCNGLAVQTGPQSFWMDGKTAEAALFQLSFYRDAAKTEEISGVKITFESLTSRIAPGGSQMMIDAYAGKGTLQIYDAPRADDRVVSLAGSRLLAADDIKNSFAMDRGLKTSVRAHMYYTMSGSGTLSFAETDSFWVRRRTPIGIEDVAYQLGAVTFKLAHSGSLSLPSVFSDHMVLQREQSVPVWGTAKAGSKITVEFAGQTKTAVADFSKHWKVMLDPMPASSKPRKLQVSSSGFQRSFSDVLVGEVWLCSGQSNMQMPLGGWLPKCPIDNSEAEIAAANYPQIRLFDIPRVPSLIPRETTGARWSACTPDTVRSFSACAYYFGRKLQQDLNVPVGLLLAAWGGTRIGPWTPPCGFAGVGGLDDLCQKSQNLTELSFSSTGVPLDPSVLYNGMLHANVPFAIRGAVWYQGEANHGEGRLYIDKTRALLNGWRKLWGYDFPFYFVQIAPYQYGDERLPIFWEAQSEIVKAIPKTGMAVITDCSTLDNIHPPNKKIPGTRLALLAEANTYGMDVVSTGPVFQTLEKKGRKLIVHFSSAEGLATRDGVAPDWFEVAGADGIFKSAEAEIDGADIILQSPDVSRPEQVRFAWSKLATPNLVNGAGLPASAFRADISNEL